MSVRELVLGEIIATPTFPYCFSCQRRGYCDIHQTVVIMPAKKFA